MDHKAEFVLLVQQQLGAKAAEEIEWTGPRLVCIAGDYTKYDEHAVQQINRNIELIRYRRYGDGLLLLEIVNRALVQLPNRKTAPQSAPEDASNQGSEGASGGHLAGADRDLVDLFEALSAFCLALGDDVIAKELRHYVAFKRMRNFLAVKVRTRMRCLLAWVKVDPDDVTLEPGFTRDDRAVGSYPARNHRPLRAGSGARQAAHREELPDELTRGQAAAGARLPCDESIWCIFGGVNSVNNVDVLTWP